MWKYTNKEEGIEIIGTRQTIVDELNIHTVYFEDRDEEELVDVSRPSHWNRIVEEYQLTGDDTEQ